uniref:Muscarinic acetylcholine receptor M3 n=1 Tax=Lygus hesperus TaxID=30085 RepID=A0A0A9XPP9_LYGHE
MDEPNKPEGAEGQRKTLPPQVEKMLASAREMEAILTSKLTKIDAVSLEKSEMAKQEALKIKADVEEIKRLSLIQTYEGEEALKAKIMEVNQRIETTTRKAAELQVAGSLSDSSLSETMWMILRSMAH